LLEYYPIACGTTDIISNTKNLSLSSAVTLVTDQDNIKSSALKVLDSFVTLYSITMDGTTAGSQFCYMFWFKVQTYNNNGVIFDMYSSTVMGGLTIRFNLLTGNIKIEACKNPAIDVWSTYAAGSLALNTWAHFSISYDGMGGVFFHLNGVSVVDIIDTNFGNNINVFDKIFLGKSGRVSTSTYSKIDGIYDEIKILRVAFTGSGENVVKEMGYLQPYTVT